MTGSLHWQTTRLSTCLVTSSRRRFVGAQKEKPSRKIFKDIASSTRPFRGGPLSTRGDRGRRATEDLPLASKVLTSPEVRHLSLPPAKNLPI